MGFGQHGQQGVPDGLVARGLQQGFAGGGERGDACGGIEEDGQYGAGRAFGAVVLQLEVFPADVAGMQLYVLGGEGILTAAHGLLL